MSRISQYRGPVVREEEIKIKLVVGESVYKRCEKAVKTLVTPSVEPSEMGSRTDLLIEYTLWCEYFGDVAKALQAIEEILDDPETVVREADCAALEEGRILVFEVLTKLQDVIRKVKGVTPPATVEGK